MQYTFKFYFDAALIILSLVEQFYPATFPSCLCTEIIFTVLISQHLFAVIKIYTVIIQSFIYRRLDLLITLINKLCLNRFCLYDVDAQFDLQSLNLNLGKNPTLPELYQVYLLVRAKCVRPAEQLR